MPSYQKTCFEVVQVGARAAGGTVGALLRYQVLTAPWRDRLFQKKHFDDQAIFFF